MIGGFPSQWASKAESAPRVWRLDRVLPLSWRPSHQRYFIEFEIRSKFTMFWFRICLNDHNEILQTSRQCNWRDVCKTWLLSTEYVMNKSITPFFLLNFEFDENINNGTGVRPIVFPSLLMTPLRFIESKCCCSSRFDKKRIHRLTHLVCEKQMNCDQR